MSLTTTIQSQLTDRAVADYLMAKVRYELSERYGLYLSSADDFDIDDQRRVLLDNEISGTNFLPWTPSNEKFAEFIGAAVHLRDMDGEAR